MEFNKAYNKSDFLSFLRTNFLPSDFKEECSKIELTTKTKYTKQVTKLGVCPSLDLVVYEVIHTSKHDARVGLSKEAFRMLTDEFEDCALVIFVPQDSQSNYRFSLIEIQIEENEESATISRKYSNPHRLSYYLGESVSYYTPNKYLNEQGRVTSGDDLRNRFSVDILTKAFYQELSDWYAWAINIIRFPNDINDNSDDDKYNNESAIRLITRLIFVWFLKQRHIIPDSFFDEDYIANNLIINFNPHVKEDFFYKSNESKYYKAILQNLFFAMLNNPITPEFKKTISERHFRKGRKDFDNNKLMRYENYFQDPQLFVDISNSTVPFLNGGLFDCLDDKDKGMYYDGFSDGKKIQKALIVPDYLFFGEEIGKDIDLSEWYGDKKKKKVSARGIIDILKRYNFTVEENTPFDKEVSLDPELLGKVFENLLAAFNPETKMTARKQTGSFYTPREIVQYMVDESLVAHLKRTVGNSLEKEYRKLMYYTDDEIILTNEQKSKIIQSLYKNKILDPACGSGAFPMGILQQMVHILNRIDPDNTQWKEMMLNKAINETSEAYHSLSHEERKEIISDIEINFDENINRPDYARKLYLIENCIYGIDIQSIAIQISKLRFFISLVVDQKINDNPIDNFGISPLPNLEAKFIAANTLIGLNKNDTDLWDSDVIKQKEQNLKKAKHKIFGAKTIRTKRKYKKQVSILRFEIANQLKQCGAIGNNEVRQLTNWDMFDQNVSSPFFDSEWMFGIKEGFDIVIGNPPYLKEGRASKTVFDGVHDSKYYNGKMDLWYMFACYGIDFLSDNGVLCFIATNNWVTNSGASKLRKKVVNDTQILQMCDFSNFMIFESASIQTMVMLFKKNKDEDNYLIDNRKLIGNTKLSDVVDLLAKKESKRIEYLNPIFNRKTYLGEFLTFSFYEKFLTKINEAQNVIYLTKDEVANGIHTNFDFVTNDIAKKNELKVGQGIFGLSNDELNKLELTNKEYTLIKPYYNGSDLVKQYYTNPDNKLWLIYTDSHYKKSNSMNNYPNLKRHLDKFTNIISSDNKPYGLHRSRKEYLFKGEKIAALRKSSDRPLFSYSDFDCYLSAAFYIIKTDRVNMKYLVALLNSKLIQFWLKNKGKMQGINYQLDKEPLVKVPIVITTEKNQEIIETLVNYIISTNFQNQSNYSTNSKHITKIIEEVINAIIYEIYFPQEFKTAKINIISHINIKDDFSTFYKKIEANNSVLLSQIRLMNTRLKDILKPISTI